jgi:DNA-binding GntR family transcriptional regulator
MAGEKATRAGTVHAQLRDEIFRGTLHPGQRLRVVELARRFAVSQSVLREALTRLSEQGLVDAAPQQGFSVITLSLRGLNELTEARMDIEALILRRSVERGDLAWEATLVAAHHSLAGTPLVLPEGVFNNAWFTVHEQFHHALLLGCGNSRMLDVATELRDAANIYMRWSGTVGQDYGRDVTHEHRELLEAALARNPDTAADLIARHIDRTAAALRPLTPR